MRYIPVLTIAGSDSSGGAGVQADIKTISAIGCYAASAITAVTVQNTLGVEAVAALSADIVEGQICAVMDDIRPRAVKIGMVNDAETIHAIADTLRRYVGIPIVVDPVMVATSGSRLMQQEAVAAFTAELLPLATLLTPNIPEAEALSDVAIVDEASCDEAGRRIGGNVLIKGGHVAGDSKQDRLYDVEGRLVEVFDAPAVATRNTHGTGCSLSSAIASYMAMPGVGMVEAIRRAKTYVTAAIKAGSDVEIGFGHGPMNHFFNPKPMILL